MKRFVFLLVLAILGFSSCTKEVDKLVSDDMGNYIPSFKCEDEMLVFKDSIEFVKMISFLISNSSNNGSTGFLNKPDGFVSMLDVYNQANLVVGDKNYIDYCNSYPSVFCKVGADSSYFYELKIPRVLAMITNSSGLLKVGDMYVMYSNDYIYKSNNLSSLEAVLSTNYKQIANDVSKQQTFSNIGVLDEKSEYSYKTAYFDTKHRIVARLYKYQGDYSYYYYDAKTTAQKKGFLGIWTQEVIDMIHVARSGGYVVDTYGLDENSILPLSVTYYYNYSEVMINVTCLRYGFANNSASYCSASHSGTRDGVTVSINTNNVFF